MRVAGKKVTKLLEMIEHEKLQKKSVQRINCFKVHFPAYQSVSVLAMNIRS